MDLEVSRNGIKNFILEMSNMKIAVAGTGYVGLSIATLLAQHHEVMAIDIIEEKVNMINNKSLLFRIMKLRLF